MKKIGLIGFGAIGHHLYAQLQKDGYEVVFILTTKKVEGQIYSHLMITTPAALEEKCRAGLDLVIEAANYQAVKDYAPIILKYADMAILSSTSLADESFHQKVLTLCSAHQTRLFVPHGALMGLDGIMDAGQAIKSVTITSTKTPQSYGENHTQKTIIYEGNTRAVCKLYPRNVNVHASVALAGLGFDETKSVIVSDPDAQGNMHEVEVKGDGFAFKVQTLSSTASQVSSAYTLLSAYGSVKRILKQQGVVIV